VRPSRCRPRWHTAVSQVGARYAYSRAQHQATSGEAVLTVYLPDHDGGALGSGGDGNGDGDGGSSSSSSSSSSEGSDDGPHAGEVGATKQTERRSLVKRRGKRCLVRSRFAPLSLFSIARALLPSLARSVVLDFNRRDAE
jgi:hypothetical protein